MLFAIRARMYWVLLLLLLLLLLLPLPFIQNLVLLSPYLVAVFLPQLQVSARVSHPTPLKLQSFDGLVDHSCMEDQEKKGSILSKVTDKRQHQ